MKVTDLLEVTLPCKELCLKDRIRELTEKGIRFAIYASNMIPFQLGVTVGGNRKLTLAEFDNNLTSEEVLLEIQNNDQYEVALIEDFLALIGNPQFDVREYSAIVCVGSRFEYLEEFGQVSVHTFLEEARDDKGEKKINVHVRLAPENASFNPGIKFLLVKKD